MSVAIVTGASKGLGRALSSALARSGWSVVVDSRGEDALAATRSELSALVEPGRSVVALAGDVSDAAHRRRLVDAARKLGGLDLVVNNASTLGPTPMPGLSSYDVEDLRRVFEVNAVAPLALLQEALPVLASSANPRVIDVTSDASVEAYEGWGGYGASKAALDHLGAVLAVEEPTVRIWTVDPGDMRTEMHQNAFPGEDISDRPPPESVVPALVALIESDLPSARYRLAELETVSVGAFSKVSEVEGR